MDDRQRLLSMTINVLPGYLIAEIYGLLAHYLGMTSMGYGDILLLSLAADGGTIFFMLLLVKVKNLSRSGFILIFSCELILFMCTYSVVVYMLNELRALALVYSLVAIMILLPFSNYKESIIISLGSIIVYISASYAAIYFGGQSGSFSKELYYTISFIPIIIILTFIAYRITTQRIIIQSDGELLRKMNETLRKTNSNLELTNKIARYEMDLAANVQSLLLPPAPHDIKNWEIALRFKPMFGASGDFYDFYRTNGILQGISLFDVSGHGISSALITMIVKPITFNNFSSMKNEGMDTILKRVDEQISREMPRIENFISCVMLRIAGTRVEYVNAGHPDILCRKKSGEVSFVVADDRMFRGVPLGMNIEHNGPEVVRFDIEPGDAILMYTDGLICSKNKTNEMFGFERLTGSMKDAPDGSAESMLEFIAGRFNSFTEGNEMNDDFTIILAKMTALPD